MHNKDYEIDRKKVVAQIFDQANDHVTYWADKTPEERLNAACFIINQIYGVTPQTKVDRSVVSKRKHS